ncbi:MAG: hypothetical protein ACOYN4_15945 [Bacteroidales bacterium]
MKKLYTFLMAVIVSTVVMAQSPQKMSYQAVVRNSNNQLVPNQMVGMKISILIGSAFGTAVYTEMQTPTTNGNGLVSIEIGGGTGFAAIDWANGMYFIKTETDPTGGTNYTITGTSQLLSVPYALHAKTAESIVGGGTETDPVWTAASVNYYTKPDMQTSGTAQLHFNNLTNKPTTVAGYGITDAMTTAHPANSISTTNIGNWNTAFGWGNHTGLYRPITYVPAWGEITSNPFLFTAPINNQLIKYNAVSGKWENWSANFLTSYTETDPVWVAASGNYYTKTNMQNSGTSQLHFNNLTNKPTTIAGYGITDAMTTAHPANGISATNISNWNTAYSWGNHSGLYRPITYVPAWSEITSNPFQFTASTNNQLIKYNASSGKWENWTSNFLTTYTETDPVWTAASGNYYTKANMQNSGSSQLHFNNLTNKPTTIAGYGIMDAMTTAHPANAITATNISNWNTAYGWGNHATAGYQPFITAGTVDQYYRGDKTWQTLFAGTGGSYGSVTTAARSDHVHDGEFILNQTTTSQTAGFNLTGSGAFTTKAISTSSTGNGIIGIGNNATLSGFPLYNGGGAFLGTAIGVFGQAANTSGERAGGFFRTDGSAYARVGGYNSSGAAKLIWGVGAMSSAIRSQDGLMADMSSTLNPENVVVDYGTGKLENGKCSITIDPVITKRIFVSEIYPIKVFIQLEGDCNGVYVTNKSANGFDVVELMGGKSDVPFSWTFTANLNDIFAPDGSLVSKNLGSRAKEYNETPVK